MPEDLQGLLDRINKEGLDKAEEAKAEIIAEAKEKAKAIVEDAKKDAERIVSDAQKDVATLQAAGESGCRQAARDVVVSLEGDIKAILSNIVKQSVADSMTPEALGDLVSILAKAYVDGTEPTLEAMASAEQAESLKQTFVAKLADTFKGGIEVKPVPGVDAGVKVSFNGESVVHDFTADAVSEMMCAYLNPRILQIVSNSKED